MPHYWPVEVPIKQPKRVYCQSGGPKYSDDDPEKLKKCGREMTRIPYVQGDGKRLVRVGDPEDYQLDEIGGSGPRETVEMWACPACDLVKKWPRSR